MPANPVYITCNSVDISDSVDWRSIDSISVLTKENASLKFNVRITPGQTTPAKTVPKIKDIVNLYDASGLIFAGTVTETEATIEGLMLTWQITVSDWGYLFDGTLVKKNYAMMDPHDIVLDIVATFAAGKGFTTNHVQTGNFLVPSIRFNYQQPTKCLQSLANLIGWDWYIDPQKDIHFFLGDIEDAVGEGGSAPVTIDGTSGEIEWNSIDLDQNVQNMKNSVFVIGGTYKKTFTALNTSDSYLTDGIASVFPLAYAYDTATITVTLNGVVQTIGIDQQTDPSSVDVLYNDKNRFIRFTSGAPTSGKTVKTYGDAQVPIVAHAGDATGIATYGEFQDVILDAKITTVPEAQARAQAEILKFGHSVYDVKFKTLQTGIRIGQLVSMNLPQFGVTNYPLIVKRVEATGYVPGQNGMLEYQVEAIGSDTVTFTDLLTTLLQQEATQNPIDDSTVIENLEVIAEIIATEDAAIPTAMSGPYAVGPAATPIRLGFSKVA